MRTLLIVACLLVLVLPGASAEEPTSTDATAPTESETQATADSSFVGIGPPDPGSGCKPNCY